MATTTDTEGLITSIYNGLLLRDPTSVESAYWADQIDGGLITPIGLVLLGAEEPEFTGATWQIARMFEAAFGRYASVEQLMAWRVVYDTGLPLQDIGLNFILSSEFSANNANPSSTTEYLRAMASRGFGRDVTQAELDNYVPLVDSGVLDYGDILQLLAENNGRGVQVGLAMLAAGLNGVAPEASTIDVLDESISVAINTILVNSPFYSSLSTALDLVEDNGQLLISGELTAELSLNLTELTVTVDGLDQELRSGKLNNVVAVDASGLTDTGSVAFVGSAGDDIYAASSAGDTIRGAGGDDQLTGGAGVDSFLFETTAAVNGIDIIADFQLDMLDALDFSAFLKLTDSNYIGLVDAESSAAVSWSDGDILVVVGNGLTTPTAIAGLFGYDLAFAEPGSRGKAVVVAVDVVGDATVWYLVNQVATDTISKDEISQVAVLSGIENLSFSNLDSSSPFYFTALTEDTFSLVESSGNLTLSGSLAGDMFLGLDTLTVTVASVPVELNDGMLNLVTSVDATGLTSTATVSFSGTSGAESYVASSAGDTIRAGGGDDQLSAGTGADSFIFEATATGNGLDTISDFQINTPDVLDFSDFLTITGTSNIAVIDAESTGEVAWDNGDVLVVEGYDLTTADTIDGLFGADSVFAAPTSRGKAVVITADIVGDTTVWYLVNQVTTDTVEADELTCVALLGGVNNLGLLSFSVDNFA